MKAKFQSAVIFVREMAVSRRFYEDLLGQEVEMDFGPNVGYKAGFALWQADHAYSVMFDPAPDVGEKLGRDNLEIYFEVDDLDGLWAELMAAGTAMVHPIREQPWGQRVGRVYDPDGHIVEVAEPMPVTVRRLLDAGLTAEQVAARTAMPLPFIERVAAGGG